ncbi:MAG: GspH/FimT family pseudopilin [Arenimonas sp.]|nr:GspH/FimT family pseudopilin [Arenimonas sp.]
MRSRFAAFTLVELGATLAIAAVLLALALPPLTQLRAHVQTRSASHALSASFAGARLAAVTRRRPVSVCPVDAAGHCRSDGVWDQGWMVYYDPDRRRAPRAPSDILRTAEPGKGVRVRSSASRSHVRFLPQGRTGGSNLSLMVCSGHPRVDGTRVVLSNGGRIRSERLAPGHPACRGA